MIPILLGNSHVLVYKEYPEIEIVYFNAATAYNLIEPKSNTCSYKQLCNVWESKRKTQPVLFHFGSIDCRIHIYLHHKRTGKSISELIDKTIERYLSAIIMTRNRSFSVMIHGVVPEKEDNIYNYEYYSDEETRIRIFNEFNIKMMIHSKRLNIPYFNLYQIPELINTETGLLQPNTTSDMVHIDANKFPQIKDYLLKFIGENYV